MKYRALGLICGRAKRYDTLHKLAMGKPKKQAALELDLNSYELRRGGRVIPLERQPMELLILLADRHGQLVTRDEIGLRLWVRVVLSAQNPSSTTAFTSCVCSWVTLVQIRL